MLQNMFKKINKGEFSKTFNNINNNMFNNFSKQNNPKIDMFSKNLFTPNRSYEGAEDLTAAQKFGGQNLQGLQKIGSGRDRDVYALDKDKVLKVAKNPGGLTQNTGERDLVYLGMGEQLEHGKDYVVMKRQQPLSKQGKQKLGKIRRTVGFKDINTLSGDDNVLDETGIGTDILDFQPNPREVFANRQWGEDEEGNLVLLDGGALQDNKSLSRYRVKDYKPEDWQYQDWQEVQRQRQEFRDKGTYDKEKKFNRKYYVDPAYPYRETFNELTEEQRQEERSEFLRKQYEQQPLQDDESKNLIQSLWHAGDKPPSETLNEQGRVFGFSSKEYADGWREKKGKQNIYQFTTDEYILDDKTYIRDTPTGKKYNDNEYIVKNVLNESIYVDDESKDKTIKPKKFKPLREMTIADKPVQIFNNHPIPKKSVIEKVYDKIPDDTNIPLQFMTRKQYVKKYVKNQELANGQGFDKQTKQEFFDYKKDKYANIVGRYTTKNNSFYEPAVVIFNDPENQSNIKGKKFKELAWHEYGHELVEQKQIEMCELTEEEFADYLAEEMVHNNQDCPKKVLKTFLQNRNI